MTDISREAVEAYAWRHEDESIFLGEAAVKVGDSNIAERGEAFRETAAMLRALRDALDAAETREAGLKNAISETLVAIDDYLGPGMHWQGQTPDWYVRAAFFSCYGCAPEDYSTPPEPQS